MKLILGLVGGLVASIIIGFFFQHLLPFEFIPIGIIILAAPWAGLIIFLKIRKPKATYKGGENEKITKQLSDKEHRLFYIMPLQELSGTQFEDYTSVVLRLNGFDVSNTVGGSADGGVDLIAQKPGSVKIAVQCKHYKTKVENEIINQIMGSKGIYGCAAAMVVTNSTYTRQAVIAAATLGVTLIDGFTLDQLRNKAHKSSDPKLMKNGSDKAPKWKQIDPKSQYGLILERAKKKK